MNLLQFPFILIGGLILAAILVIFFLNRKNIKSLTPLAASGFACIIAGVIFGDNIIVGYSLIGAGVLLAVTDIFVKPKK
jgi:hypothetical protein